MNNLNFTGYLIYKNRELVADSPPLPRQVGGTKIVRFWSTVGSDNLQVDNKLWTTDRKIDHTFLAGLFKTQSAHRLRVFIVVERKLNGNRESTFVGMLHTFRCRGKISSRMMPRQIQTLHRSHPHQHNQNNQNNQQQLRHRAILFHCGSHRDSSPLPPSLTSSLSFSSVSQPMPLPIPSSAPVSVLRRISVKSMLSASMPSASILPASKHGNPFMLNDSVLMVDSETSVGTVFSALISDFHVSSSSSHPVPPQIKCVALKKNHRLVGFLPPIAYLKHIALSMPQKEHAHAHRHMPIEQLFRLYAEKEQLRWIRDRRQGRPLSSSTNTNACTSATTSTPSSSLDWLGALRAVTPQHTLLGSLKLFNEHPHLQQHSLPVFVWVSKLYQPSEWGIRGALTAQDLIIALSRLLSDHSEREVTPPSTPPARANSHAHARAYIKSETSAETRVDAEATAEGAAAVVNERRGAGGGEKNGDSVLLRRLAQLTVGEVLEKEEKATKNSRGKGRGRTRDRIREQGALVQEDSTVREALQQLCGEGERARQGEAEKEQSGANRAHLVVVNGVNRPVGSFSCTDYFSALGRELGVPPSHYAVRDRSGGGDRARDASRTPLLDARVGEIMRGLAADKGGRDTITRDHTLPQLLSTLARTGTLPLLSSRTIINQSVVFIPEL